MNLLTLFNGCEALLWMVLAGIAVVHFRSATSNLRRASLVMAVFLVAFGISDLIEIQTGAWWRPAGLLIFKGLCLLGLTASMVRIIALERTSRGERTADDADTRGKRQEN